MDFISIKQQILKNGCLEIYPDFIVNRSKDLMIRGNKFYAIWDQERNMWSTDEYDVQRLVDKELFDYKNNLVSNDNVRVRYLRDYSSRAWSEFKSYCNNLADAYKEMDMVVTFNNTMVRKEDYITKRLPYNLESYPIPNYEELISTLYNQEERDKFEWAIGAIIAGDAKWIQKFIVFYADPGGGKSTVINIIQKIFEGYYCLMDAKELTSSNNQFSTESFKNNPLVAIQHDGDLSRIEDNTKINSIVSHEEMTVNEKYKNKYTMRMYAFLFIGTNKPVKITDAKSGIIRRLIDIKTSGRHVTPERYEQLVAAINFEIGGIANFCLEKYKSMGANYYSGYKPIDMMLETDVFYNFIESNYFLFKNSNGISLQQAFKIYKEYCEECLIDFKIPRHKFREELKQYFEKFYEVTRVDGQQVRSYYEGFIDKIDKPKINKISATPSTWIRLESGIESYLDVICRDQPAQYAKNDIPSKPWNKVTTTLSDINTSETHYIKDNDRQHIIIDFDKKNDNGEKDLELNIKAATKFPPTYAEVSKGGSGLHLHYIYNGNIEELVNLIEEDIEIKKFVGNASLRRRLSMCNDESIFTLPEGSLPKKERSETVVNLGVIKTEAGLRKMVIRNLNKEIHSNTTSSVNFIKQILDEAYESGVIYDLSDMRAAVFNFAMGSSHQPQQCMKQVTLMKWASETCEVIPDEIVDDRICFFDVEVFPNLFVVVYKFRGWDEIFVMINPTPQEIEPMLSFKLIGFNCRKYDNHILYARYIGYDNKQLYGLSQKIITKAPNAMLREAYNVSYSDIYEYSTKKQSLKKWEIQLGIHHLELGLDWNKPVPEHLWKKVGDYCQNDVIATEAVFEATITDWKARCMMVEMTGLSHNHTIQQHVAQMVFGDVKEPWHEFIYTDLSKEFPSYKYELGKSTYRGEEVSEGGEIYAVPGMYWNVGLFDIASMHPTTCRVLKVFGPYEEVYDDLVDARLDIKHDNLERASKRLDGALAKYITPEETGTLAYTLKIVINIVYGLTAAKFQNRFKDPRNIDNIVAKRGSLFMKDLRIAVEEQGYKVAHIKTDSIKIPNYDENIKEFIMQFGKKYGYTFEHEASYDRLCLVNKAVYVCHDPSKTKHNGWSATGTQFSVPYVFKKLFSHEEITFEDLCEVKQVSNSVIYLVTDEDEEFIGKVGQFCPMLESHGKRLEKVTEEGKHDSVTGAKGFYWLESEYVKAHDLFDYINFDYFEAQVKEAIETIQKFGDFDEFVNIDDEIPFK